MSLYLKGRHLNLFSIDDCIYKHNLYRSINRSSAWSFIIESRKRHGTLIHSIGDINLCSICVLQIKH